MLCLNIGTRPQSFQENRSRNQFILRCGEGGIRPPDADVHDVVLRAASVAFADVLSALRPSSGRASSVRIPRMLHSDSGIQTILTFPSEREGFEPSVQSPTQLLSREPDSAALAPLQFGFGITNLAVFRVVQIPHQRRGWDSNPRQVAPHRFSRPAP